MLTSSFPGKLTVLFASILLALPGCFSDEKKHKASDPYTGLTKPASITVSNAGSIVSLLFDSPSGNGASNIVGKSGPRAGNTAMGTGLPVQIMTLSRESVAGNEMNRGVTGKDYQVNQTVQGSVSGTLTITGTIASDGSSMNVTGVYSNFNDGDGLTINGTVVLKATVDSGGNSVISASYNPITFKGTGVDDYQSGLMTITENTSQNSESIVINMYLLDNISGESYKYVNFAVTDVYDNIYYATRYSETISGRLYIGSLGYIDVSTVSPLTYSSVINANPDGGGPLIITNGTSSIRITPMTATTVRIEVDQNGDGVYENTSEENW